jgi:hypothetical protein
MCGNGAGIGMMKTIISIVKTIILKIILKILKK